MGNTSSYSYNVRPLSVQEVGHVNPEEFLTMQEASGSRAKLLSKLASLCVSY